MMKNIFILLNLYVSIMYSSEIVTNNEIGKQEIFSSSKIYLDYTKSLKINDMKNEKIPFITNNTSTICYGYSPNFNVWIKFTLKNDSKKTIYKILEYGNSMTTDIVFYDKDKEIHLKEGLLHTSEYRNSINPIFNIIIPPNTSKTYYIKASSYITTLIIKLNLYNDNQFYKKEIQHQVILSLFFGAMFILALYNLFIYFFAKDKNYLYYSLYILAISVHHTLYVGIANLYIIDNFDMNYILQFSSLFFALPVFFMALFTKSFLQLEFYPILNNILNLLLILFLFTLYFFTFSDDLNQYRNIFTIIVLCYLIIITIYLSYKKNRQAYFVLIGWIIICIAIVLMYLSSIETMKIYQVYPYIIEFALLCEALIFSIALSDRINNLQKERNNVCKELIFQKRTENERLAIRVKDKTKNLNISLEEKTLLLQEINHRVKNNMQLIISLIRLQSNDISDKKIKDVFLTTKNRLNAMSQLHELLYQSDNVSYINAYEYFSNLIEELEETYSDKIIIRYNIDTNLQTDEAVSCGIILNELVTNSLKYAFLDDKGEINISLSKKNNRYSLIVKDNGMGYDNLKTKKSFGLILVDTLVSSKLKGEIKVKIENGVNTQISWSE